MSKLSQFHICCLAAGFCLNGHACAQMLEWDNSVLSGHGFSDVFALGWSGDPCDPLWAGGKASSKQGALRSWDGDSWELIAHSFCGSFTRVSAIAVGEASSVYIGGNFECVKWGIGGKYDASALNVAQWDGSGWAELGSGLGLGHEGELLAMRYVPGEDGGLFIGGRGLQDPKSKGIDGYTMAKWADDEWSFSTELGELVGYCQAFEVYTIGQEDRLVAGGSFLIPCPIDSKRTVIAPLAILSTDGSVWSIIETPFLMDEKCFPGFGYVFSLKVYDGYLYIGGNFDGVGGPSGTVNARGIVRWDGSNWSAVGNGLPEGSIVGPMEVFDGKLYVAGNFGSGSNIRTWDSKTDTWDEADELSAPYTMLRVQQGRRDMLVASHDLAVLEYPDTCPPDLNNDSVLDFF